MHKSNSRGASPQPLDHGLHAIDATPARRRGGAGSSSLDGASTAASSPRNDLVKNCRVHPTHWLIYAQVLRPSSVVKSIRNIGRVNREVKAMRAANHAGICRLFDVMQTPSHIYLVLEKGDRDLYALIDDYPGGCPETVVKSATRVLVLALRHCHTTMRIAHRDIKPENVLVCGDPHTWHQNPDAGIVKLCDFGLCADIPEDGWLLSDFVGSPGFFAPELLQRPAYDGARADLFSLGAVIVELIFGHDFFGAVWYPVVWKSNLRRVRPESPR